MNIAAYQMDDTDEYLAKIFPYLVRRGLENVTIRELCKGTGIVQGSLYYRFPDKTSIVCEATKFGFKSITDKIFDYVFASLNDLRAFFSDCLGEVDKYKDELRFIYQMAASPIYGDNIRVAGSELNVIYERYTHRLSGRLGCDENTLRPLVYLFISAVLDYAIWNEREKTQMQLEFIYSVLPQILNN